MFLLQKHKTLTLRSYTTKLIPAVSQISTRKETKYIQTQTYITHIANMTSKKQVTFKPLVEVRHTLSIYDYTATEVAAAWYDEYEMDRITKRCFKILQRYESITDAASSFRRHKNNKYCLRGLEGHTTSGTIGKRNNRSAAYTAVLETQEMQGTAETIADAYRSTSSSCQTWAHVVGCRDQQEIESYVYEDDELEEMILMARPRKVFGSASSAATLAGESKMESRSTVLSLYRPAAQAA